MLVQESSGVRFGRKTFPTICCYCPSLKCTFTKAFRSFPFGHVALRVIGSYLLFSAELNFAMLEGLMHIHTVERSVWSDQLEPSKCDESISVTFAFPLHGVSGKNKSAKHISLSKMSSSVPLTVLLRYSSIKLVMRSDTDPRKDAGMNFPSIE